MKKQLFFLLGFVALTGCVAFDTNLQSAQEDRDEALLMKRAENGCSFLREHDAYRNCLLNTYYAKNPQSYQIGQLEDGEPVAIISNPTYRYAGGYSVQRTQSIPGIAPQITPTTSSTKTTSTIPCSSGFKDLKDVPEYVPETQFQEMVPLNYQNAQQYQQFPQRQGYVNPYQPTNIPWTYHEDQYIDGTKLNYQHPIYQDVQQKTVPTYVPEANQRPYQTKAQKRKIEESKPKKESWWKKFKKKKWFQDHEDEEEY